MKQQFYFGLTLLLALLVAVPVACAASLIMTIFQGEIG